MNKLIQKLLLWILQISPTVLSAVKPMLLAQSKVLWSLGLPLAKDIVADLMDNAKLDNRAKHWAAVDALKAALIEKTKLTFETMDLSEVVLKAYRAVTTTEVAK